MPRPDLEAIKARAQAADKAICAVAQNANHFRMSVPPQPDDTDMLVTGLAREDVPALLAYIEALEQKPEITMDRPRIWNINPYFEAPDDLIADDIRATSQRAAEGILRTSIGTATPSKTMLEDAEYISRIVYLDPPGGDGPVRRVRMPTEPVEFAHPYPSLDNLEEINQFAFGVDEADLPEPGDTVHYVLRGLDGEYPEGAHRPATVIEARTITVLEETTREVVEFDLHVFNQLGAFVRLNVVYDQDGQPGTWHWPE